jgi:crotonobetainyl-CoA:carnitine CoA-transferase CaiB-like acyl-CoA transferase
MRPLAGVRILDLSRLLPGPLTTLVLADLGAEVDKIEDAGAGDYLRLAPPHADGTSVVFHALNRGKRSAVIDLKHPAGRAALERALARYDVLFEQFRPGVLDRLGLGHARLRELFPRLIVCALTGYGQNGPLRDRAGHDLNYLARGGVLGTMGPPGAPPALPGFQMADIGGGMWCVIAILAALRERDRTGQGSVLDIAMMDGAMSFAMLPIVTALATGSSARGDERLSGGFAVYNTYESADGVPMTLAALEPKFWTAFAKATGLEPELSALFPGPHQAELGARVGAIFREKTAAEWRAFAAANDCCVEPVLSPEALRDDEQVRARGVLCEQPAGAETVTVLRTPVTPPEATERRAPRAGEHTRVILREAGLEDAEIDALVASGAVRAAP